MNNYENIFQEIYIKENPIKKRSLSFTKKIDYKDKLNFKNILNLETEKKIGNYILGEKLGQGTFGIVVLAKHEITGENVAIKILDKEKIVRESDKTRLEREIRIMKIMYHNNIVHLYNVIENQRELFLVMEYISGKELFDYIIQKRHLDELESCKFYQQILSGIEYLGKTKVTHRDLKPENLLLDSKKNIKIVDFGLSNTYFQNELLSTACGSPCYAAPEMLSGKKYSGLNIDIWSSGIVLYAMLCGYLPFEDNENPKLYKKIIKGVFDTPNFISPYAVDLLHRILNVDPEKRYTIEQIKEHPWFNQIEPKLNMSEGLLIEYYIVPFDEEIIKQMVNEYSYNEQQVKMNLLINKHNHITTTYFLLVRKKIRKGEKTIGDMTSQLFIDYINDKNNLLSSYNFDFNAIINDRVLNENNNNNDKKVIKEKETICNNENKIKLKKHDNNDESQFKCYENNISKIKKHSKYTNNNIIEKEFNTLDKDKFFDTLETEKQSKRKKEKIKKNKNSTKNNNLITYENKEQIYKNKENIKTNCYKAKMKSNRENNIKFNPNNYIKDYIPNKSNKKNLLNNNYFYSTFTENNLKNVSQTNEDISLEENNHKKIINRITLLKESIIKSLKNKNKYSQTNKNLSEKTKESINSTFSSPKPFPYPHCFSNKNIFKKIKPKYLNNKYNIQKNFLKIDTSQELKDKNFKTSKEKKKILKLNNSPFLSTNIKGRGQHEIIRIIQRIKNKTKSMNTKTLLEKSLKNNGYIYPFKNIYNRTNLYINSASRISRTPNNLVRNINENKIILEHNMNNGLNNKIFEINFQNKESKNKNENNSINNGNNINIHINLTNIYKNIRPMSQNKDDSSFNYNNDKIKIIQNHDKNIKKIKEKNIKELMRQNKFIDNNPKNRKFFIDTSVSLEKMNDDIGRRRRLIESENKENKFLVYKINPRKELLNNIKNIINKNNDIRNTSTKRDVEDTSLQRKEKDLRYLKIKSKNKKFNELKINKLNSLNHNSESIQLNSIVNNTDKDKNNLIRIKKKTSISNKNFNDNLNKKFNYMSINLHSFYNSKINNSRLKINTVNNINNKSFPKKAIYNAKQIFNSINTEFYQSNEGRYTTTSFNFYHNRKTNNNKEISKIEFYRDKILKKRHNLKSNILSERNIKKKFEGLKTKKSEIKKNYFLKPFDLNSLVFVNKNNDIKNRINHVLNSKDINYNEGNNKYNCYKKEIKFDINIINLIDMEGGYIIKSILKYVNSNNSIKLKNLYNNIVFKIISNIK